MAKSQTLRTGSVAAAVVAAAAISVDIVPTKEISIILLDGMIYVSLPVDKKLEPSSSGKTFLVATTGGFKPGGDEAMYEGHEVRVNLTAYVYREEGETSAELPDDLESGEVKVEVQPGKVQAFLTQEALLLAVPACTPRASGSGKMMLINPPGGNIKTGLMIGDKELIVNFTAGYYAQPKPPRA